MTNATAPRADIHRPAAPEFDPQAYDLAGVYDLEAEWPDTRHDDTAAMFARGYRFTSVHPTGRCGHCGAHIRYAALMLHPATRGMIYVGEQCLDNRFLGDLTADQFQRLRRTAQLHRERNTARERATAGIAELCAHNPLLADLTYPEITAEYGYFVDDVAARFRATGELTERQEAAIVRAFERHIQRATAEQDTPPAVPAPTGVTVVTGEVCSVRVDSNPFGQGSVTKMLVLDDRGFKTWGTMPADLRHADVGRGTRVTFTATLAVKGDDPAFAIATRPRRASVID